jgi:hypothetical protein
MKQILTLSMLFIGISCFAQKQSLVLSLKLDSTYYMSTNANLTVTEQIPGQTMVITTIMSCRVAHKVTAIRDSVYELEVAYKSFNMHMDLPGGKSVDIRTDDANSNQLVNKVMRTMLDKPFIVTINNRGKVLDIKNSQNLYSEMLSSLPDSVSAQKREQFKAQMEQALGEKSFKTTFQDAFAVLPDVKVDINDHWSATTNLESTVSVQIKNTYTLQRITNKEYMIHGDAVVNSPDSPEYKQVNGIPMRYIHLSGSSTTDIELDKTTGWVNKEKVTRLVKGTMDVKDSPQVPGGVKFPMTVNADMMVAGE